MSLHVGDNVLFPKIHIGHHPISLLDLIGSPGDFFARDRGQRCRDLRMIDCEKLVDPHALQHRVGNKRNFILRPDFRFEEMPGGLDARDYPVRRIESEIE
ncbi:MAG: hypothetical protein NT147_04365 [Candidatus Aminicenantes bacterium]|nr:hypothetical protein [Candidatus Aminicenantes bacterium]